MNESRPVNMPPVVRFLGSLVRGAKDLLERGESKMEKGIEVAMHDIEVAMHDVDIDVNMKLLLCFISIGYFLGVVFVMLSPAPPRPSATKSARSKSKAKELEQEDREKNWAHAEAALTFFGKCEFFLVWFLLPSGPHLVSRPLTKLSFELVYRVSCDRRGCCHEGVLAHFI